MSEMEHADRPGYEQARQAMRGAAFQGRWSIREMLDIVYPIIAAAVRAETKIPAAAEDGRP